jgi:hypothetical protein
MPRKLVKLLPGSFYAWFLPYSNYSTLLFAVTAAEHGNYTQEWENSCWC